MNEIEFVLEIIEEAVYDVSNLQETTQEKQVVQIKRTTCLDYII